MLDKRTLEKLAVLRLDDAGYLLNNDRASSAYYLAGYAVELGLKACIAKSIHSNAIPDLAFVRSIYSHNLSDLIGVAGLTQLLNEEIDSNQDFAKHWAITNQWNGTSRYEVWDIMAARTLFVAIGDNQTGVFQWMKKFW